jgi:hypothetical protein
MAVLLVSSHLSRASRRLSSFSRTFSLFHPGRALGNSGPLGSAETKTLNQSVQAEADLAHVTGISLCLSFAAPQPPLFLGRRLGQLKASITRLSLGLTQPAHPPSLRGHLSASEVSPIIAPKGWLKARNNGIFKTRYLEAYPHSLFVEEQYSVKELAVCDSGLIRTFPCSRDGHWPLNFRRLRRLRPGRR